MAKFHSSFPLLLFLLTTTSISDCTSPSPSTITTSTPTPTPTLISTPISNATTIILPPPPLPLPPPTPISTPTPNATTITLPPLPLPLPQPQPQLSPPPSPIDIPTHNATTITRPPLPSPPPLILRPLQQGLQLDHQEQLDNIIEALIGAGNFKGWASVLSISADFFPLSATLFIPADDSFPPPPTTTTIGPFIIPYHIVPQRLSFADLRQLKLFSRLPTLLPAKSILITNNSFSNFTLDAVRLSHPDFYTTSAFVVHGIANLLNYSLYSDPAAVKPSEPKILHHALPPPPIFMAGDDEEEELIGSNRHPHQPEAEADVACLCNNGVWTIFLVVCTVLASKIQGMSTGLMDFLV